MVVDEKAIRGAACALLDTAFQRVLDALAEDGIDSTLGAVARGDLLPDIRYRIQPLSALITEGDANDVDLVYSHAAIEHIWRVADFWQAIIGLTKPGGWHSHRIDLADHGRRDTNYFEMLEWSPMAYWLTMRFVPGSINRWARLNAPERPRPKRVEDSERKSRDPSRPAYPTTSIRLFGRWRNRIYGQPLWT